MKIGTKLYGGLAVIAMSTILGAGISYYFDSAEQRSLETAQGLFTQVTGKNMALVAVAKDININVVQVQQFLTDISATRGLDGLDDGSELAEAQAKALTENVVKGITLSRDLKQPELQTAFEHIRADFTPYYDVGKRMSEAYVKGGPAAGNPMMLGFDAKAEKLAESVSHMLEIVGKATSASVETTNRELSKARGQADMIDNLTTGIAALTVLVCAGIAVFISKSALAPLIQMTEAVASLAGGNLNVLIPAASDDEIGAMAHAMGVFKSNMVDAENLRAERQAQERKAEESRRAAMHSLASGFEQRVGELAKSVAAAATELCATAQAMATTTGTTIDQASSVETMSESTAHNASAIAAATEELSASFAEINRRATDSITIVGRAVSQTQRTRETITNLDEAATRIGKVVNLIGDIAEQTNLLALNATIEAARAGESGRGFAVVAAEVKALAAQTAKATGEVTTQINAIQRAVQESSRSMDEVSATVANVNEISGAIAASVEEQAATTASIAQTVGEASRSSSDIRSSISHVLSGAREVGASANEVLAASDELSRSGEALSHQVDTFLREVRAT